MTTLAAAAALTIVWPDLDLMLFPLGKNVTLPIR
jgi:hypothetical protein